MEKRQEIKQKARVVWGVNCVGDGATDFDCFLRHGYKVKAAALKEEKQLEKVSKRVSEAGFECVV